MIQMYALNIFQKLISYHLYDSKGMRKDQSQPLDEVIVQTVQRLQLATKYLAKSSKRTEFHKSTDTSRNEYDKKNQHPCTLCGRIFKSQINLTLHIYWHAIKNTQVCDTNDNICNSDVDVDESSEDESSDSDCENCSNGKKEPKRFVASPGWVIRFNERHDLGKYKMRGEKGSADYAAVGPWVESFLSYLFTQYVEKDHKSLSQILTIILNFDETGFQYKSLPQYSYLQKKQEIRAKKPVLCRITGLFGSSANGRKFKPLIIGKAARPRAFKNLNSLSNLPVYYYHNKSAWMTQDIFRDWFLNCFLSEVQPILDPDMQIQFLVDNCSTHNDPDLMIMDPKVHIKFLPANTTSLIQPMDQAVLACVKSYQKKIFSINCLDIMRSILTQGHLNYF